jgi:hypothetical protein
LGFALKGQAKFNPTNMFFDGTLHFFKCADIPLGTFPFCDVPADKDVFPHSLKIRRTYTK